MGRERDAVPAVGVGAGAQVLDGRLTVGPLPHRAVHAGDELPEASVELQWIRPAAPAVGELVGEERGKQLAAGNEDARLVAELGEQGQLRRGAAEVVERAVPERVAVIQGEGEARPEQVEPADAVPLANVGQVDPQADLVEHLGQRHPQHRDASEPGGHERLQLATVGEQDDGRAGSTVLEDDLPAELQVVDGEAVGMAALGQYYAQFGKLLLASTMRLQSMSDRTLSRMGRQLEESRSQIDTLVAATLEYRFREVESAEVRSAETRESESRNALVRDAVSQLAEAAKAVASMGGPAELAPVMALVREKPEVLALLQSEPVKQLLANPEELKALLAMVAPAEVAP